jgi:hypothetical protein
MARTRDQATAHPGEKRPARRDARGQFVRTRPRPGERRLPDGGPMIQGTDDASCGMPDFAETRHG